MIKYFTIEDLLKHYLQKKFHTLKLHFTTSPISINKRNMKINAFYSTVTDFARFLGLSTSHPLPIET